MVSVPPSARDAPTRRLAADERRPALVGAAYRAIAARGFEGLRVRAIAADVGINVATLHYHFPTKEALVAAVVDHLVARIVATTTVAEGAPLARLRAHLAALHDLMRDEPDLVVVLSELLLRARRDPAISPALQASQDAWLAFLVGLLGEGVACGDIRADADPQAAGLTVQAVLKGMTLQLEAREEALAAALAQLDRWLTGAGEDQAATAAPRPLRQRS